MPRKPSARQTELRERKRRFRIALAQAEMTAAQWAEEHDVTAGHLAHVLSGNHPSNRLLKQIEEFTDKHIRMVAA